MSRKRLQSLSVRIAPTRCERLMKGVAQRFQSVSRVSKRVALQDRLKPRNQTLYALMNVQMKRLFSFALLLGTAILAVSVARGQTEIRSLPAIQSRAEF